MTCAQVRLSLGAHVLGALDPAERADVEAHLSTCPGCREELAELAVLPGLLSRVDLADLHDLDLADDDVSYETSERAGEHVLDAVLFQVARERRAARRRRAFLTTVGLVAAAAVAAVLALVVPGRGPAPAAPVAVARTVVADAPGGVHFTADLSPRGWGTEVVLHLSGVPRGQWCQLVAVGADGRTEVAASWVASYAGRADVTGATSLPLASLASLRITTDQGTIASAAVPS